MLCLTEDCSLLKTFFDTFGEMMLSGKGLSPTTHVNVDNVAGEQNTLLKGEH